MTREKEIKAHLYEHPVSAGIDIRYLLARNDELQLRVVVMEKALQFYARLDDDMIYDEIEEDHGRRAVEALQKEQDDD